MILTARITGMRIKTKGKGEDLEVGAVLTLEVDDAEEWELDHLTALMKGGTGREIAIDEGVARRVG